MGLVLLHTSAKLVMFIKVTRYQAGQVFSGMTFIIRLTNISLSLSLSLAGRNTDRVFENRVLRIFGPKREEDRSWRKLNNDELHSLYSSPNIVRVIKARRMRWAGHAARMEEVFTGF
jgi:hypothetical protein